MKKLLGANTRLQPQQTSQQLQDLKNQLIQMGQICLGNLHQTNDSFQKLMLDDHGLDDNGINGGIDDHSLDDNGINDGAAIGSCGQRDETLEGLRFAPGQHPLSSFAEVYTG
jgi:hypothetical protein